VEEQGLHRLEVWYRREELYHGGRGGCAAVAVENIAGNPQGSLVGRGFGWLGAYASSHAGCGD
jgi:hypothetical protein